MAGARDELELDLNLDNATAAAAAITAAAATASAQDFFLINGLPTDLLVTIVALAAQQMDKEGPFWQDPSGTIWIRHSFPLVCKRWKAIFASKDAICLFSSCALVFVFFYAVWSAGREIVFLPFVWRAGSVEKEKRERERRVPPPFFFSRSRSRKKTGIDSQPSTFLSFRASSRTPLSLSLSPSILRRCSSRPPDKRAALLLIVACITNDAVAVLREQQVSTAETSINRQTNERTDGQRPGLLVARLPAGASFAWLLLLPALSASLTVAPGRERDRGAERVQRHARKTNRKKQWQRIERR
jgi:hypothetical protein